MAVAEFSCHLIERCGHEPAWCEHRPPEDIAVVAVLRPVVVGDVEVRLVTADASQ